MIDRASPPDFELPATGQQRFQLSAFKGHPVVPHFYPRDNTPGCTVGGAQFRVMKMKNLHGTVLDFVKSTKL
ncbi:MAG TPA: redoxin domain-containing protein [Usitatibacter sp.]|nr:redoxin domain-containing protein [Usitatibacter sp.]